ncbi:uncharacterized protein LOC122058022 [Macadamia integrifolia]|uniref:uncharacterized protein LOC122058022 n=1 Tax=Macadamia integrifolia TaxID=60698 RepID=UPI001C52AD89|nr:uncharacterized protein LOC122058022 [Macadamia integrifolia]
MASDNTPMTILQLNSSTLQLEDEDEDEIEDGKDKDDHHRHASHSHYLSRLSICNTSGSGSKPPTFTPNLYDDDDGGVGVGVIGGDITDMGLDMARLSIEGFSEEEDADEELSDGKEGRNIKGVSIGISSDSDKETGCHSLPSTPPWMRRRARPCGYDYGNLLALGLKEYASENEAQRTTTTTTRRRRSCFRKTTTTNYCCSSPSWTRKRLAGPAMTDIDRNREGTRWGLGLERAWDEKKNNHHHKYGKVKAEEEEEEEEEEGSECVVITRPKGGGRSLCMDLEEVKACRDLGFELDHERMMMVDTPSTPGRISISVPSASTIDFDTSSGGNSPIANWRISSPGDDPRDVKARLKVWAQAVALASTSR